MFRRDALLNGRRVVLFGLAVLQAVFVSGAAEEAFGKGSADRYLTTSTVKRFMPRPQQTNVSSNEKGKGKLLLRIPSGGSRCP